LKINTLKKGLVVVGMKTLAPFRRSSSRCFTKPINNQDHQVNTHALKINTLKKGLVVVGMKTLAPFRRSSRNVSNNLSTIKIIKTIKHINLFKVRRKCYYDLFGVSSILLRTK
jgi:hypothetical protein